jgi:histone H3/H4
MKLALDLWLDSFPVERILKNRTKHEEARTRIQSQVSREGMDMHGECSYSVAKLERKLRRSDKSSPTKLFLFTKILFQALQ